MLGEPAPVASLRIWGVNPMPCRRITIVLCRVADDTKFFHSRLVFQPQVATYARSKQSLMAFDKTSTP
jgi:hypothetical protein